jgi:hypothetical protein
VLIKRTLASSIALKLYTVAFSFAFFSLFYLLVVLPFGLFVGEADLFLKSIAAMFALLITSVFFRKIQKFAEQILDENQKDIQKGGSLENNSPQD